MERGEYRLAMLFVCRGSARFEFENALAARNISTYTIEDLDSDMETLKRLGRL